TFNTSSPLYIPSPPLGRVWRRRSSEVGIFHSGDFAEYASGDFVHFTPGDDSDGVFDERAHSPLRHCQPSVGVSIPRNERRDSTDLPAHRAADAKRTCLKTTGCIQIRQSSQAAKEATIATRLITTRSKTKAKRLNRTVCCTGAILVVCRTSIVRLSYDNVLD